MPLPISASKSFEQALENFYSDLHLQDNASSCLQWFLSCEYAWLQKSELDFFKVTFFSKGLLSGFGDAVPSCLVSDTALLLPLQVTLVLRVIQFPTLSYTAPNLLHFSGL